MATPFVLDSFALLTFFLAQPGSMDVVELFTQARRKEIELSLSTVNLGGVLYTVEQRLGLRRAQEALAAIEQLPVNVVPVDRDLAIRAARAKIDMGMGYADCFVVGLAQRLRATIVTGDRDFEKVFGLSLHWLPPTS